MGGFGSGRWTRNERKWLVNECHSIDVRMWKKQGWLEPRTTFTFSNGLFIQVYQGYLELRFTSADGVTDVSIATPNTSIFIDKIVISVGSVRLLFVRHADDTHSYSINVMATIAAGHAATLRMPAN